MATDLRRILIVDDSAEDRAVAIRLLSKAANWDWRFTEASKGEEGLTLALTGGPFDCILLDYCLPEMDGSEFLKLLKERLGEPGVATVVLTGTGDESVAVRAMKSGAQDYLSKTYLNSELLLRAVENAISRFQLILANLKSSQALAQSEERLRLAYEAAQMAQSVGGVGTWDWDIRSNATAVSPSCYPLHGLKTDHTPLTYADWLALVYQEDRPRVDTTLRHAFAEGESFDFEYRVVWPDECIHWLRGTGQVRHDAGRHPVRCSGAVANINDRKRMELALRDRDHRLRAIFQSAFQFIGLLTPDGILVEVNRAALDFGGLSENDVLGMPFWDAPWWTASLETQQQLREAIARAAAGEFVRYDVEVRGKGERTMYIDFSLSPGRDEKGEVVLLVPEGRNIEDRKRAESDLRRSNEGLQLFADAASHDLKSPANTVTTLTELISKRYRGRLDSEGDKIIGMILAATGRMQDLITDLLRYTRAGAPEEPQLMTSMTDALNAALIDLHQSIEESGAVISHHNLPVVTVQGTQIRHVFQNLIANAIKYSRSSETPRIDISAQRQDGRWVFVIGDNGQGFEPQFAESIFLPFKRLHGNEIPGSGIGLATCRKILDRHGGKIWAESMPGRGSTFYFTLPAAIVTPLGVKGQVA